MTCFVTGDTIVKFLAQTSNIGQIIAIRSLMACVITIALIHHRKAWQDLKYIFNKKVMIRTMAETMATLFFFLGLLELPLGNANAIMQVIPLSVTLGAALFLGEAVGWRRWLAIWIGFAGVMLIIRPGFEGFNAYALYTLLAVIFVTLRDLITRTFDGHVPSLPATFAMTVTTAILGGFMMLPAGEVSPVSATEYAWMALGAFILIVGQETVIYAMRIGDMSFISPLRYISLPIALFWGFVIFEEIPDIYMLMGSVIVVAMGIYTFHRERLSLKRKVPMAQTRLRTH